MTPPEGPPRLTQSVTTPASLRRAIKSATRLQPTPADLERMASSLASLRITMAPPEPAESEADLHSGLRPVHPAMTVFMAKRPRRKVMVAARAMAAILAASFSVTWASVRLWRSSIAAHAPIVHAQVTSRLLPPVAPPVNHPSPVAIPETPVAPEAPLPEIVAPQPAASPAVHRGHRPSARLERAVAAPQPVQEVAPVQPEATPKASPEVQLLLAARRELRSDPAEALRWVREHERRFPNGTLSQEREVIAIQALRKLDRREEANERIARFRERYPSSIHGRRIDNRVTGSPSDDGLEKVLSGSN